MKKITWILTVVFLLSLIAAVPVFAQGSDVTKAPGTWVSSIEIQNTGTGDADQIFIIFYRPDGSLALNYEVSPAIPEGGSRSFYVPDPSGIGKDLEDGQFSVVIQSSNPLQVVANSSSEFPATAGAYTGFQDNQLGTELFFPGLYKDYYGFWSELVIQNTEATDATVNIDFFSQSTGAMTSGGVSNVTIPGNGSKVFPLQDLSGVPSGNTDGLLSAKVTSSNRLAGVANVWSSAFHGEFGDYNGYTSGSTDVVYAPALYKNYYNFVSSMTVQNIDSSGDANVKVTYSNGETETKTLKPFQAVEYYQPANSDLPSGNTNGVFSAKVESLNSKQIVVLVNVEDKTKGLFASYNGPAGATTQVGCPVVLKEFFEWFSAQTVQNVGTSNTDITIEYADGKSRTFKDVPPNGTRNFVELEPDSVLDDGSSLSAVITSTGEPIVAVVQENSESRYSSTPGDYLLAYTCVAQP
jgi:hypothetical protein